MAGTVLAVMLYKLIKALEYESANPDPELGPTPPPVAEARDMVNVQNEDGTVTRQPAPVNGNANGRKIEV